MRELKIGTSITNRTEARSLEIYLNEIGKTPLLTPEEEVDLARKIRESGGGDKESIDKLIKANLLFVVSVAKQYQNKGLSLGDLISEGNLGLIKAAERFDETKGFKFISYAVWWIRQSILLSIAEKSRMIKPPFTNKPEESVRVINEAIQKFLQDNEREPTREELAEILETGEERLQTLLNSRQTHNSLNAPIEENEENTFLDLIKGNFASPDRKTAYNESLKKDLERVLEKILSKKEYYVITQLFGIGLEYSKTISDLAEEFNLTEQGIKDIREKALKKIKVNLKIKDLLKEYL